MDGLRIITLGGVKVELGGEMVEFSRYKSLALLVFLAVTNERSSRESLAAMFWPENTQGRALANLRQAIWVIRSSLGENWLEASRESLQLVNEQNIWVDTTEFHDLLIMVKQHSHPNGMVCEQCLEQLKQAALIFNGDFLSGFSLRDSPEFDNWQYFQKEELNREIGSVYNQLVDWCAEQQEFDQAIYYARHWLLLDELNENAHRALMRLYYAKGERNAAIQQYYSCATLLEEQLNITPEAITIELHAMIRSGALDQITEPEETQPIPGPKLPTPVTPFVGRKEEVSKLLQVILNSDTRLLTIVAPGGMGKSRLAIEIARKLMPHFEDGVLFVPLAPLENPEMFISYFANAINYIRIEGQPLDKQLSDYFREKSMVLILDNLEHLLEKSGWIRDLLANSPRLKILATSRIPLNITAESRFHLGGLNFPEEDSKKDLNSFEAVKLFLRCVHRAKPLFKPTEDDWQNIGEICRLVGGMPLGIEMAASWLEMLSMPEIVKEIQRSLSFFETDIRDVPRRQQSLYKVFDYSWKMLDKKERDLFSQLSIFRGGFTRDAAERVIGTTLRQLVGFANRSLLNRTPSDRFEIHELLRQYGFEKLQGNLVSYQQLLTRYAKYYCNKLGVWRNELKTGRQRQAMEKISADFENIVHAWETAVFFEHPDLIDTSFEGLILYLIQRVRYDDGIALFELAAENISDKTRQGIRIISWLTGHLVLLHLTQGNLDQLENYFQKNLDLIRRIEPIQTREEKYAQAFHYYIKGIYAEHHGDIRQSTNLLHKSINLFEELDDAWWCAVIYQDIGTASWLTQWDLIKNHNYLQKALKIAQDLNNNYLMAVTLERLGVFSAYSKGDLNKAKSYLQESSRIFLELNDANSYIRHYNCLEQIANFDGRFEAVVELRQKHLHLLEKLGNPYGISELYMLLGEAYHHIGDYDTAEIKGRKGFEYLSKRGSKFFQGWSCWFLSLTLISKKDYQQAFNLLNQAVEISQEITNKPNLVGNLAALIRVEIAKVNLESAERLLYQGLQEAIIAGEPFMMLYILASAALLLAVRGYIEKALEVYSLVHSWAFVSNSVWFSDVYKKPLLSLSGTEDIIVKERQTKDTLWQMAESLLADLKQAEEAEIN